MRAVGLFLMLLISPIMSFGASGDELLRELSQSIEQLGRYEVNFILRVSEQASVSSGNYLVDSQRYILSLSGFKIYGDNSLRYSVDQMNREVVIERMESSMPMIVVNPASAFVELDRYFNASVQKSDAAVIQIRLEPKRRSTLVEGATLLLDAQSKLPREVIYLADGDEVRVVIESIVSTEQQIPMLEEIGYPDEYEVIDLR